MTNWDAGTYDPIAPALRARLDRIANAERDRRAGRDAVAIATIGEPVEWPARVVVALAHLAPEEGIAARRMLEAGLDAWASEFGLGDLDPATATTSDVDAAREAESDDRWQDPRSAPRETPDDALAAPLENFELDRAFEEAETEVESMRDVNSVAEHVLSEESHELDAARLDDDPSSPFILGEEVAYAEPAAAVYSDGSDGADELERDRDEDAGIASGIAFAIGLEGEAEGNAQQTDANRRILAKLEGWLVNIEARRARIEQYAKGSVR